MDLIKWTHDNTFSIAEVRKDTGKLEVTDLKAASGLDTPKAFQEIFYNMEKLWNEAITKNTNEAWKAWSEV